jgi:hypothetical protein
MLGRMKEYFLFFIISVAAISGTWTLLGFLSSSGELRRLLTSPAGDELESESLQEQKESEHGGEIRPESGRDAIT